jgi:hypothetical protein
LGEEGHLTGRRGHAAQPRKVNQLVYDDVASPLEVAPVDHQVAGDQQACAAVGPPAVEAKVPFGRLPVSVREVLRHGRLGDPVPQRQAARQGERITNRG